MSFDIEAALSELSEQRRIQALSFKHELGRRQSAASYLLLKRALRDNYGIDENPIFDYDANGKPTLRNHPDIHFNISHCRTAVAVALGNKPVGIDIESIRPFKDALARHVLNDTEYASVIAFERPDIEFIKQWTRKEALLKYTGEGIRRELKTVGTIELPIITIVEEGKGYVYSYIL